VATLLSLYLFIHFSTCDAVENVNASNCTMTESVRSENIANSSPSESNRIVSDGQDVELVDLQATNVANREDVPPDGGYGWVCTVCMFLINAHTWGVNSVGSE
jgi:hypothetical protein